MFCTDVLRAWAECSFKDFSQAWGEGWGKGFGYSGREMALIHHTELGRLVVRVPFLLAAVWRNVHNLTELCEASAHLSICPYTSTPTFNIQPSPLNRTSVQVPICASTPPVPLCVVGECALLIPLSQLSQKAGSLSDAEGKRGVWQSLSPWREGNGKLTRPRSIAAEVNRSYQLSGVSWVSMSTLQMGHFLLVANHWSTHAWWKRCMQGNLLRRQERQGQEFKTSVKASFQNVKLCNNPRGLWYKWLIDHQI